MRISMPMLHISNSLHFIYIYKNIFLPTLIENISFQPNYNVLFKFRPIPIWRIRQVPSFPLLFAEASFQTPVFIYF